MEITKAKSTSTEVKVTDKIVDPNPLGEHIYLLKSAGEAFYLRKESLESNKIPPVMST